MSVSPSFLTSFRYTISRSIIKAERERELVKKSASYSRIIPLETMSEKLNVCIVGSGNWGSAIAKIIGANVCKYNNKFVQRVPMYVYEEIINNQKLTSIINELHENIKYLPGHKLPENVVSISKEINLFYKINKTRFAEKILFIF
ncbi:hypothetical protein V1478_012326 [Vespula squamosa]|uniref:Glycerol-3-phosphate dehydrogenase NAD-dependent N-terminal domain-containing protein n=1 Tax=Vespula squamosa TaxID=30214 RepID=A0ABD2AF52_VESSQ